MESLQSTSGNPDSLVIAKFREKERKAHDQNDLIYRCTNKCFPLLNMITLIPVVSGNGNKSDMEDNGVR